MMMLFLLPALIFLLCLAVGLWNPGMVVRWQEAPGRGEAVFVFGTLAVTAGMLATVKSLRDFFSVMVILSLYLLIVGLINPKLVIRWGEKRVRWQAVALYGFLTVAFCLGVPPETPEELAAPAERQRVEEKNKEARQAAEEKEKVDQQKAQMKAQAEQEKQAGEKAAQEQHRMLQEKQDYKNTCRHIDYKALARNPDQYAGKRVVYNGKVIQVTESGTNVGLRVYVSRKGTGGYEQWDDVVWVDYARQAGESRILEDDYLTFYGEFQGIKRYTAVMGNEVAVPKVSARYIEF